MPLWRLHSPAIYNNAHDMIIRSDKWSHQRIGTKFEWWDFEITEFDFERAGTLLYCSSTNQCLQEKKNYRFVAFQARVKKTLAAQSSHIVRWGSKGGRGRGRWMEKHQISIHFVEKPQCRSHLQLLWNYVVGMLTNWALSWIARVVACWGAMVQ